MKTRRLGESRSNSKEDIVHPSSLRTFSEANNTTLARACRGESVWAEAVGQHQQGSIASSYNPKKINVDVVKKLLSRCLYYVIYGATIMSATVYLGIEYTILTQVLMTLSIIATVFLAVIVLIKVLNNSNESLALRLNKIRGLFNTLMLVCIIPAAAYAGHLILALGPESILAMLFASCGFALVCLSTLVYGHYLLSGPGRANDVNNFFRLLLWPVKIAALILCATCFIFADILSMPFMLMASGVLGVVFSIFYLTQSIFNALETMALVSATEQNSILRMGSGTEAVNDILVDLAAANVVINIFRVFADILKIVIAVKSMLEEDDARDNSKKGKQDKGSLAFFKVARNTFLGEMITNLLNGDLKRSGSGNKDWQIVDENGVNIFDSAKKVTAVYAHEPFEPLVAEVIDPNPRGYQGLQYISADTNADNGLRGRKSI